ncbi:MAG: hypothetical protein FD180_1179 [Planctomycetota bacterium]|nr:MAG: hypothetical protein FD180_1179 [Planctomycetota bacterium]
MDSFTMWFRAFPTVTLIVGVVLGLILFKKLFGKSGPKEGQNWVVILLLVGVVGAIVAAVWGFRNVRPPDNSGMTWK